MKLKGILLLALMIFGETAGSLCTGQVHIENFQDSSKSEYYFGAYNLINPPILHEPDLTNPIIVAVIDDAFSLSHNDLKDFIYVNLNERATNLIDDDGNRKIDDLQGWDIADNDNNVSPREGFENSFYHGTYISSSIIKVVRMCFNDSAKDLVKILPIKVLSDFSTLADYSKGYDGIEYAIEQNVDIICCAWSGGQASEEQKAIVRKAHDLGILIIGSAGNFYSPTVPPPGSLPGVLTIGAVDSLMHKIPSSNYGPDMDLVAPGQSVLAAFPSADNSYFYGDGTSGAAGIVCGCAAVLKILKPKLDANEIKDALINTAEALEKQNPTLSGRLGAGIPNLSSAVDFISEPGKKNEFFSGNRPKGKLFIDKGMTTQNWTLSPKGAYHGFNFTIEGERKYSRFSRLSFYSDDAIWFSTSLDSFPGKVFIPGSKVKVEYERKRIAPRVSFKLAYEAQAIDSTTLFCQDTRYYHIPEALISDGSGKENYSNNCSCKWQIIAPTGKRIRIEFEQFKTQDMIDFVYLFDGESTIPGNIIAKFSGSRLPITVTSRSNKVLVWFVSDNSFTDEGWRLNYNFVE